MSELIRQNCVAVVGGGIAGLAVALDLLDEAARRNHPLQVTVFEKDEQKLPGRQLRWPRE